MARLVLILAIVLGIRARAFADDAVALLPLDADQKLVIYGQPVASELARALAAGGVDVVVVGPKMAMPDRVKLVVDGTISSKGEIVSLTLRVRNPIDGTTLATVAATAQGLPNIDKAAAELSSKLLPIVKTQFELLHKPAGTPVTAVKLPDPHVAVIAPEPARPMLFAVSGTGTNDVLRGALATAFTPQAEAHHRAVQPTDFAQLTTKLAPGTLHKANADLAIALDVRDYTVTAAKVPFARAKVRVRIADGTGLLFDRVVVTDSVVGDKSIAPDVLASRTAREVLDILRPHLRRAVPSWR